MTVGKRKVRFYKSNSLHMYYIAAKNWTRLGGDSLKFLSRLTAVSVHMFRFCGDVSLQLEKKKERKIWLSNAFHECRRHYTLPKSNWGIRRYTTHFDCDQLLPSMSLSLHSLDIGLLDRFSAPFISQNVSDFRRLPLPSMTSFFFDGMNHDSACR